MKTIGGGLVVLATLWFFPMAAYSDYSYFDLNPSGWTESHAACVSAQGTVAGYGWTGSSQRGFLWSSGDFTELLPPGADGSKAAWVNGRGEVAGTATYGGRSHAFLYRDGTYLDPTPGWAYSEATYVSEEGAVAGTGEFGAYISKDSVPLLLPGFTVVVGANTAGQLLGSAENTARLFRPGNGYLTLCPPGASAAVPGGLNESGLVAISSREADSTKGFVYSGGFYVFMTPPGWSSSNAMAINNGSQVVGYGMSPAGRRSFLRSGAVFEELSFPGWMATEAVSLNDAGEVAGSGQTADGATHAFLALPAGVARGDGAAIVSSGWVAGGGGCSVSTGRSTGASPSAWGNLPVLLLPLLFPLFLGRIGRTGRNATLR